MNIARSVFVCSTLLLIALLSYDLSYAKQGSGGVPPAETETTTEPETTTTTTEPEPVVEETEPVTEEPTPTPVETEPTTVEAEASSSSVAVEPVVSSESSSSQSSVVRVRKKEKEEEVASSASSAETSTTTSSAPSLPVEVADPSAQSNPTPTTPVVEEKVVVCNDLTDHTERVECRLTKDHDELAKEPYNPEGCRWGSKLWQDNCKQLYKKIYPCYDQPVGAERIGCIKEELGLPETLQPVATFCDGKVPTCAESYRKKVHWLIVARLYDAEERVEDWFEQGKVDLETARDFVVFISEQKWAFYGAETKEERLTVLLKVDARWQDLVASLQSN